MVSPIQGELSAEFDAAEANLERLARLSIYAEEAWSVLSEPQSMHGHDAEAWDDVVGSERNGLMEGLGLVLRVEDSVPSPAWAPRLSADAYETIGEAVDTYRDALPFGPAERRWLFTGLNVPNSPPPIAEFAARSDWIVKDGHVTVASGGALLQRWWEWRYSRASFAESGTVAIARTALSRLHQLIPS